MRMLQEEPEEMKEETPENKDAIRKSKDYQPDGHHKRGCNHPRDEHHLE